MQEEKNLAMAKKIAVKISENGGQAYFVGGYVRDKLRGMENKDIDIEVHGITPQALEKILDTLGTFIRSAILTLILLCPERKRLQVGATAILKLMSTPLSALKKRQAAVILQLMRLCKIFSQKKLLITLEE